MARYIDADEYRKRLEMICGDGYTKQVIDIFIDWFMSIAESTETEDVAPVVHAHWIHDFIDADWNCGVEIHCGWVCSHCGGYAEMESKTKYCPNCGAKMDEEVLE